MNALEIKNITKKYGDFHLENIGKYIKEINDVVELV